MATSTVGTAAATSTMNSDVYSVFRRLNRYIVEIAKSQSSGISQIMPYDVDRVTSYLKSWRAHLDYIVGQPLLDYPETGPTEIPLPAIAPPTQIENESMYDLVLEIGYARDELTNSQSGRQPSNLMPFDYKRQISYIDKITNQLAYVAANEPLDLPESSPMVLMSGKGQLGI